MGAGWGGGLEGQVLLRLEDATILALCHLPHELLGPALLSWAQGVEGWAQRLGTQKLSGIWDLRQHSSHQPLLVSHHPLPQDN